MSKRHNIIDFEIIWKKIHFRLSKEEDELLRGWLEENPKHQRFFNLAKNFYLKGSQFVNDQNDVEHSWKVVQKKTKQSMNRIGMYASAVAACTLIVVGLFYLTNIEFQNNSLSEKAHLIEPGTNKAVLVLSNGITYNLSDHKGLELNDGNSVIKSTGSQLQYNSTKKRIEEIKYNTLQVPRGGEFFVQLSDGSKVWLNSETTLRYPLQFSGKQRRVELSGEAYFEVLGNKELPFLVASGSQIVKVTGTRFNVTSYDDDPAIITTLVEGEVKVFENDNSKNNQRLWPNRQSIFSKETNRITTKKVDPSNFTAWKEGRFAFDNELLYDITKTLSRWYDIDFIFANENKKYIRFTGNLQRYTNIQDILRKIEKTEEVNFIINSNTIMIE